jgi:O-antigen ligase
MQSILEHKKDLCINAGIATLSLTLFLMPFPRSWSLYSLGAFLFFGFVLWISDFQRILRIFSERYTTLLPLVLYFFLFVIGLFFTKPQWGYIEGNLMFLLIPVLGFPILISDKFSNSIYLILKAFIYGLLVICIFEYGRAIWNSISFSDGTLNFNPLLDPITSRFRSDQLSFIEHPTYLSLKVLMAIAILILMKNDLRLSRIEIVAEVTLLTIFVYSLSSRTGLLIAFFLLIYFIYKLLTYFRIAYLVFFIVPLVALILFKILSLNDRVVERTGPVWKRYKEGKLNIKDIDPRFTSWFTACDIIKKHPVFGVGLDARNILTEEYKKKGYNVEASLRFNAHNQFLETQLALGIPGTLILLWMLLLPVLRRKRSWNPELIFPFLIIVFASMIFESILVRQWGIMFFVLFYCMLLIPEVQSTKT